MAMTTTLTSMASLSQTLQCNNNHRDVSFSSFLNAEEETFIRKLAESRQELNKHKDHIHLNHNQHHDEAEEDVDEIGVFGAEKYFNSGMDDDEDDGDDNPGVANMVSPISGKYHQPKRDVLHKTATPDRLVKPKSRLGTPSVRSESSCNSQTALFRGPLTRTLSRKRTNKVQGKSLLAAIGCNYCCSDKESVDVRDEFKKPATTDRDPVAVQQHKGIIRQLPTKQPIRISLDVNKQNGQVEGSSWIKEEKLKIQSCQDFDSLQGIGQRKENCFAFPALSSSSGDLSLKMRVLDDHHPEEPKFLKSLEVFRKANSFGLEKKLPWDFLTPRMEQQAGIEASSGGGYNDDNESDASSDLFEIESISGKVTSGCLTPRTCYAPSEASVDWSVVTASAADFSVLSGYDHDQLRPWTSPMRELSVKGATKSRNNWRDKELPRPGILMGCNSQKAVKVAGDAHRTNIIRCNNNGPRDLRRMSDSYLPVLERFQADQGKLAFGQFNQVATANSHLIHRSRSPNDSRHL